MTDSIADDSWIAYRTPAGTVLNLNDCVVEDARTMKFIRRAVGDVKVLLTQFSYANWVGNPEDVEVRKNAAQIRLDTFIAQVRQIEPRYVIPFASFIYFAHEENWYMNDSMNTVDRVVARIERETKAVPVVLYPGDAWRMGDERANAPAIVRYTRDLRDRLAEGPVYASQPSTKEAIESALSTFYARLRKKLSPAFRLYPLDSNVYLPDLDMSIRMSLRGYGATPGRNAGGARTAISRRTARTCFLRLKLHGAETRCTSMAAL